MTLAYRIPRRAALLCALGLLALVLGIPGTGQGASNGTISHIHFGASVGLPAGVVLPAGDYTFEAVRPDVVRVLSRDGLQVFYAGFTNRIPRPRELDLDTMVAFGERAADGVPPVRAWYPTPTGSGHAFIYR